MPTFESPISGLPKDRKLTDEELFREIQAMLASEYEVNQLYKQLRVMRKITRKGGS